MNTPSSIDIPGLLSLGRHSRGINLHASRVRTLGGGLAQSRIKGRGMEYAESRLYTVGDDIRNIDWRVTARTGKVYTKLFQEERERPVFFIIDYRLPMFFATRGRYKAVMASECAVLLAWSVIQQGDRIGGIIFSEQQHKEWEPGRGRAIVVWLIHQLVAHPAWSSYRDAAGDAGEPSLDRAIRRLQRVAKPGSLLFLLSDFRHLGAAERNRLLNMSKHNEIVLLFIHDRFEKELPPNGQFRLADGAGEYLVNCSDRHFRERYARYFGKRCAQLRNLAQAPGIRLLECATHEDPLRLLRYALH